MVDRIEELETERVVGIKNVTVNGTLLRRSFPGLSSDARRPDHRSHGAGCGALLVLSGIPDRKSKLVLLAGCRWREIPQAGAPWRPACGMEMKILRKPGVDGEDASGVATVDGTIVAEAEMLGVLADRQ